MHRLHRRLLSLVVLALLAAPAIYAAGPAAAAEAPKSGKASGQYVDMSPVGVPVIWRGRLVNYVFVTLRLTIRPGVDVMKLREKEPYFRDALVRLAHRSPLNPPNDFTRVDEPALKTKMLAESARIVGPGQVTSVQVVTQAPQRRTGLPTQ